LLELLAGLPAWAVEQGCNDIRMGALGTKFAPTHPEVLRYVQGLVAPFDRMFADVQALYVKPVKPKSEADARALAEDERMVSLGAFWAPRFFAALRRLGIPIGARVKPVRLYPMGSPLAGPVTDPLRKPGELEMTNEERAWRERDVIFAGKYGEQIAAMPDRKKPRE
jgi:hypothetical protein